MFKTISIFTIITCISLTYATKSEGQVWNKVTGVFSKNNDLPSINTEELNAIKNDINVLTSKEANGRKSGTKGEEFSSIFIENRMKAIGLLANSKNEYKYRFMFESEKKLSKDCKLSIGNKYIFIPEEAIPMAFVKHSTEEENFIMPGSEEPHAPWITPLYKNATEAQNPNFDWEETAYKIAFKAQRKGASAVILYDEFGAVNKPIFKNSSAFDPLDIPVIILNKKSYEQHIKNIKTITPTQIKIEFSTDKQIATNVIGKIDNKAKKTIIIGACYDYLGENKTMGNGTYFTGADNNASGVALMLSLAQEIKNLDYKNFNFIFVAFSAHENGLMGAKAFLKHADFQNEDIACMIDLNKVGRLKSNKMLTIEGTGSSLAWNEATTGIQTNLAIETVSSINSNSEFIDFYNNSIPVALFTTGKNEVHGTMLDMASRLNYPGMAEVGTYIIRFIQQINNQNYTFIYKKISSKTTTPNK